MNLPSGTYTVTITDVTGNCSIEETIHVSDEESTEVVIESTTPANCLAGDGGAELSPAFLTYDWSDGGSGSIRTDLAEGTYTVTATNASSCETIIEVEIESETTLTATSTVDVLPTCGESNGQVTIGVTGGSGDYSYDPSGPILTDLPAGTATILVTDNVTGCTVEVSYILNEEVQGGATVAILPTKVSCAGETDGTVVYDVTYEADFVNPSVVTIEDEDGNEVTNGSLSPGNYCIKVEDGNGCIVVLECFEVTEPETLEVSVSTVAQTCDTNGSIELTTTGGTPDYSYDWGTIDPTNVEVGSYAVTITDANGCIVEIENIEVIYDGTGCDCEDPQIESIVVGDASCGESNGNITINVVGESTDFIYIWSPNDTTTTHEGMNLPSGTYTVTITDVTGNCSIEETIHVSDEESTEVVIESTTPANCLAGDGGAELSPAFLTYNWSDGGSGSIRTDLAEGTYTVTATNASSCETIIEVEIESETTLTATSTVDVLPTCGESNGQVTIGVTGGSGDYSYDPSGPILTDLPAGTATILVTDNVTGCTVEVSYILNEEVQGGATVAILPTKVSCAGETDGTVVYDVTYEADFVNPSVVTIEDEDGNEVTNGSLSPGNYCIKVEDGNGCIVVLECFEVTEPETLEVSVSTVAQTCDTNGSIELTTTGGTPDYSYDWGTIDPTNVEAGSYAVTITDANGCIVEIENIEVGNDAIDCDCEDPQIENIVVVESDCNESNGSITIDMVGSESDYTYEWTPDVNSTNEEAINIAAGIYEVIITNLTDNCSITETITVNDQGGTPIDTVSTTPANCLASDGGAVLTPTNLNYVWSDGGTGSFRNDLAAGEYEISATNAVGCISTYEIVIEAISPLEATVIIDTEPTCGESNGEVTIVVIGGSGDYSYDPVGPIITDLPAGLHTIIVTDNVTGCTAEVSFTLTDNIAGATVSIDPLVLSCAGDTNGTLVYTIDFEPGFAFDETVLIIDEFGMLVNNGSLGTGTYCIIVNDANGCSAATECIEITEPEALEVSISITDVICNENGNIEAIASGGTAPYDYDWAGFDPTNLSEGIYNLTVTDANNCFITIDGIEVNSSCPDECTLDIQVASTIEIESVCGESNGSITINMNSDNNDFNYSWSDNVSDGNIATGLEAGDYIVTITSTIDNNCSIIETFTIGNEDGPVVVIVDTTPATCLQDDGGAVLSPAGLTYEWSDGGTGLIRADLVAGTYSVTATDDNDCSDVITVEIESISNLIAEVEIITNPTCGESDGEVTFNITNGSGNYTYDPNIDLTALAAGTYEFTITDTNSGCSTVVIFTLTDDVGLATVIANDINLPCYGDSTGVVDYTLVLANDFVGPETIEIRNGDNEVVLDGTLSAGTYCIVVLDANGCVAGEDCFQVFEPTALEASVVLVNQTCDDLGSITLEVNGGTSPYILDWNGIDTSALITGVYSVTITDANNCQEIIDNIEITLDGNCDCDEPQVDNIIVIESTCGETNGRININMIGSLDDFIFVWSPDVSNSNVADSLASGTYTVTISDANNPSCFVIENINVTNIDGPEVTIENTSPANCTAFDGTAQLSPVSLNYTWSDGGMGAIRTDLEAGEYTITATDANDCETITTLTIESISPLEATVIIDVQPTCNEANGQVTINVTGGSGDYNYDPEGPVISGLESGTHIVMVTDNVTGCTLEVNITLTDDVAAANVMIDPLDLACASDTNGTVVYTVTYDPGFVQPASELIIDASGTPVTNGNLSEGTYCIIISDANGCVAATECFDVTEPEPLEVSIATTDVLCGDLGTISIDVTGGIAPYDFDWNGIDSSNLDQGIYNVIITDANGCSIAVENIEINELDCPEPCEDFIAASDENIIIQDCSEEGSFCVEIPLEEYLNYTITDNGTPYDGTIGGCDFDSTLSYSVFAIPSQGSFGPYNLDSWTINGQVFSTEFADINELLDSMNVWDPLGNWIFDDVSFLLKGGVMSNTYGNMNITQIPTGAFTSLEVNINLSPNGTTIGVEVGTHEMIFVNNITGCADTVDVTVACIASEIYLDTILVSTVDTFCVSTEDLQGTIISIENACEDASGEFVIFELMDEQYCVSYFGAEVGMDSACIVICDDLGFCDTTYMYITVEESMVNAPDTLPIAVVDYDTTLVNRPIGIDVTFNDTLNGEFEDIFVITDPSHGVLLDNQDGSFIYMPSEDYCDSETPDSFEYSICNEVGCDTTTVFITVLCENIIVFTGFSPNGDGVNDFFFIQGIEEYPENTLYIFNRWGNEVYVKEGYLNDWDGTYKNKALPDGTYFYVLEDGEGNEFSGYIQIHR